MTIKTPGAVATDALTGYPLGRDITREDVWQIVHDAIEADRAQRSYYLLSFEPDAIRDHFEVDEIDPTEGLTTAQLDEIGQGCLQDDRLYRTFHEVLTDALTDYREGN